MGEGLDPRKEYEEYLKRVEAGSELTDPQTEARIKAEVGRELEVGEKGGYTVLRPEASREKRMASFPQGRSSKEEDSENVGTEGREGNQMNTAEAITEIKEIVEGHNTEILALEEAISKLNKQKESELPSDKITNEHIPPEYVDRFIEVYTAHLKKLRGE